MKSIIILLIAVFLMSSAACATSDVVDSLCISQDGRFQSSAFERLITNRDPGDIQLIKNALLNDTLTTENTIDLTLVLFRIDKNKKHWAECLMTILPKRSGFVFSDLNRVHYVLEALSDYYIASNDSTAIAFILLYDSYSDGAPAGLFGPVYHKILTRAPYPFISGIYARHKDWIDQVLCGILIESRQDTAIIQRVFRKMRDKGMMDKAAVDAKIRFMRQYER